ncbi:hypothetical protein Rsub_04699 [Raphidocelis subcapitata]|uniref:DIRP domain-containing protein n=1 Tax=Raphidocelis subcapitata TaxID=307507 RepID=A0A2V0P4G5_9CHLO|nr:hypothetical protein Rsub_04699 [Raphidocelis subcapitata]|eukprot:GBF91975.1 hypothetical protein Rsub_04699 [Raphidocelis subcapitata]
MSRARAQRHGASAGAVQEEPPPRSHAEEVQQASGGGDAMEVDSPEQQQQGADAGATRPGVRRKTASQSESTPSVAAAGRQRPPRGRPQAQQQQHGAAQEGEGPVRDEGQQQQQGLDGGQQHDQQSDEQAAEEAAASGGEAGDADGDEDGGAAAANGDARAGSGEGSGDEEDDGGGEEGEEDAESEQTQGRKRRGGGGTEPDADGDGDGESLAAGRPKRARRSRKLFGDSSSDEESGRRARGSRGRAPRPADGQQQLYEPHAAWGEDDIGEGIDALLSLASIAHASEQLGDEDSGGVLRFERTPRKPVFYGGLSQGSPMGPAAARIASPAAAARAPTPRKGGRAARTARAKRAAQAAAAARAARAAAAAAAAARRELNGGDGEVDGDDGEAGAYGSDSEWQLESEGPDADGYASAPHTASRRSYGRADEGAPLDGIAAARAAAAAAAGLGAGDGGARGGRRAKAVAAAYLHEITRGGDDDGGYGGYVKQEDDYDSAGGSDDDRGRGGRRSAPYGAPRRSARGPPGLRGGPLLDAAAAARHKRKSQPGWPGGGGGGGGALARQGSDASAAAQRQQLASPAERSLRHALGNPRARRWQLCEFHYSSLDRPYFMQSEWGDYLTALGLAEDAALTRTEWGVLRGALGRPRRLSLAFLREERTHLELYRETVRKAYADPSTPLPPSLPRPLRVSQAVVARHPVTRRLADGIILTAAPNRYRVQSDLMTHVVRDTDVAAADPFENLPPALAVPAWSRFAAPRSAAQRSQVAPAVARRGRGGGASSSGGGAAAWPALALAGLASPSAVPAVDAAQLQADQPLLGRIEAAAQRKDFLLARLAALNDAAAAGAHLDAASGEPSEGFRSDYAAALADLQEVNADLAAAASDLASRAHLAVGPAELQAAFATAAAQQQASAAAAAAVAAFGGAGTGGVDAAAVDALVEAAAARARDLVAAQRPAGAGAGFEGDAEADADAAAGEAAAQGPGSGADPDRAALDALISSCVSVLLAARLATAPDAGQQQQEQDQPQLPDGRPPRCLPIGTLWAALDAALARIEPRAPGSAEAYAEVRGAVDALKRQLASVA